MTIVEIQSTWESYDILFALAPHARSYLCVGVQEGECLGHLLRGNPDIERLALCDTWDATHGGTNRGSHTHIAERLRAVGFKGRVRWMDGPSQDLVPALPKDELFDLSYVDGSHLEQDAYEDFCNVWPHTQWAMIVHDISFPEVATALGRFLYTCNGQPIETRMTPQGHGTAVLYHAL